MSSFQSLLKQVIDNQTQGLKHMQDLLSAVEGMSISPPTTAATQVNREAETSKELYYYLVHVPDDAVWKVQVRTCTSIAALEEAAACMNVVTYKFTNSGHLNSSESSVAIPYIHNTHFSCMLERRNYSHQEVTKEQVQMINHRVCLKVFTALKENTDQDLCTEEAEDARKHQYKQWIGFGLLAFIYYVKHQTEDKQRMGWPTKHEATKILFHLLRHAQQAICYERAEEANLPIFPCQPNTMYPLLRDVCHHLLEFVLVELRDNKWLWIMVCAFSFPMNYKYKVLNAVFHFTPEQVTNMLQSAKINHATDTASRVKTTASNPAERVKLCMEAMLSYAVGSMTDDLALLMWRQLLFIHQRFNFMRTNMDVSHGVPYYLDVRQLMFEYMTSCKPSTNYHHIVPRLWANEPPATTAAGWLQWVSIVSKLNAKDGVFVWEWLHQPLLTTTVDHTKYRSNIETLLTFVNELSDSPSYEYVVSKSDDWCLNENDAQYHIRRLRFLADEMWRYGPVNKWIVLLYNLYHSYETKLSFYTKFCFWLHWMSLSFKASTGVTTPPYISQRIKLLRDDGLMWWSEHIQRVARETGSMTLCYSAIDILRLYTKYHRGVFEISMNESVWNDVYRLLGESKWSSVQDKHVIILDTVPQCWKTMLYTIVGNKQYEPFELLSSEPTQKRVKLSTLKPTNAIEAGKQALWELQNTLQQFTTPEDYEKCAPGMISCAIQKCVNNDIDVSEILNSFDLSLIDHDACELILNAVRKCKLAQFCALLKAFERFVAMRDWAKAIVPELVFYKQTKMLKALLDNESIFYVPRELDYALCHVADDNNCLQLLRAVKRASQSFITEDNAIAQGSEVTKNV